ncbi:hypothetical protein [Lysinibacillus phage vB_LspM-01]|nr:hypothetical protein [Lysinibacillus phage vB_LspM-01]
MANTFVYDAGLGVIQIDGRYMQDYGEGEFVSWTKDEENFQHKTSANGTVGVATSYSQTGTVTYRPMQGSPEIKFLNQLANSRKSFPVYINSGGDNPEIVSGSRCMVKKTPDGSLGTEISAREFEIAVFDYSYE